MIPGRIDCAERVLAPTEAKMMRVLSKSNIYEELPHKKMFKEGTTTHFLDLSASNQHLLCRVAYCELSPEGRTKILNWLAKPEGSLNRVVDDLKGDDAKKIERHWDELPWPWY